MSAGNTVNIEEYRIGMLSDHIRKRKEKLQASNGAWSIKFLTPLSMKYRQEYMTEFLGGSTGKRRSQESADAGLLYRDRG